jgi:PQQ-dependent catabolism-associated CXXCW motif protein
MNIKSCTLHSLLCLSVALSLPLSAAQSETAGNEATLFSADGYRIARYRSPTPATIEQARTLDTAALQLLLQQRPDTALLNVQALQWRTGVFIEQEVRMQIPGSYWLPNVGKGALESRWENYFRVQLATLRDKDNTRPLVFYCRADCWMSWNATKRAASWGYTRLYWYPEGSDGWQDAQLPVEPAVPVPLTDAHAGAKPSTSKHPD